MLRRSKIKLTEAELETTRRENPPAYLCHDLYLTIVQGVGVIKLYLNHSYADDSPAE